MNEAEILIRSMGKDGKTARAIATELYDRGLRSKLGMAFTPAMVEGFLSYAGIDPVTTVASPRVNVSQYSKEAQPIAEPPKRPRMLRPWPLHTDYRPDNLLIRD
jgi:hypothetical protein